jgi:hypothetical protein
MSVHTKFIRELKGLTHSMRNFTDCQKNPALASVKFTVSIIQRNKGWVEQVLSAKRPAYVPAMCC